MPVKTKIKDTNRKEKAKYKITKAASSRYSEQERILKK